MATYIPSICSTQKIATEYHSVLVVFPAGILGYEPKAWPDFLKKSVATPTEFRECIYCVYLKLNTNL